jgi:hypothetical protein
MHFQGGVRLRCDALISNSFVTTLVKSAVETIAFTSFNLNKCFITHFPIPHFSLLILHHITVEPTLPNSKLCLLACAGFSCDCSNLEAKVTTDVTSLFPCHADRRRKGFQANPLGATHYTGRLLRRGVEINHQHLARDTLPSALFPSSFMRK